jgi:N6-adenosine-specific RNA methylase IME4
MTAFACIVADPPWRFSDRLPGRGRGAVKHYPCMATTEIASGFQLPPFADDAVLFLWRVAAMQRDALHVAERWGFKVKSELVWEKTTTRIEDAHARELFKLAGRYDMTTRAVRALTRAAELLQEPQTDHFGMGHYVRASHETCLICVRGKPTILDHTIRSRFRAPVGQHSEKPDRFYELVERLCPGPRVELFSRRARRGWTCLGNEVVA